MSINNDKWKAIYTVCFSTIHDNYLTWLQYKILTRILGVKVLLAELNIMSDSQCRLCGTQNETLLHLFCECSKVAPLWQNISTWIYNRINLRINMEKENILLGLLGNTNYNRPVNTIILATKGYIFGCCRQKKYQTFLL